LLTVESELNPDSMDLSRRRSSAHRFDDSAVDTGNCGEATVSGLGRLRATIKYCFDKNALVVTVNSCEGLPAKDAAAKSR
jgi:hypothetical protein